MQIAVKRREAKGKGEKERYTHLNAKFQRRARGIESPFKQTMQRNTGKKNRMGKTRDLLKKLEIQGTFHAKMATIKDRNGMDLAEAEDIKKDGKNTQKNCTKKIFLTQIITMV